MGSLLREVRRKARKSKTHRDSDEIPEVNAEEYKLDYWHGFIPNEDTALLLKRDGDFLVRSLMEEPKPICVSVREGAKVYNAVVQRTEGGGFELAGVEYPSIKDMIDELQVRKRPIQIEDAQVVLNCPVRRKQWELRHCMITLGKRLGKGSYGSVYRGVLRKDRQVIDVAVKVLSDMSPENSHALWKEARVMQMYDHPHVVRMYGVANDTEPYYLVMELVTGGALNDFLKKKGRYAKTAKRILYEASLGIEYLHSKGCIHRDIAARNLLMDKVIKVADFGLTRRSKSYIVNPDKPMNLRWLAPDVYHTGIPRTCTSVDFVRNGDRSGAGRQIGRFRQKQYRNIKMEGLTSPTYQKQIKTYKRKCKNGSKKPRPAVADKVHTGARSGLTDCTVLLKKIDGLRVRFPSVEKHTDVYAFGITMWEVFQLPYHIPYREWDADEVYQNVVDGSYRLSPQDNMPSDVAALFRECIAEPQMRPTFKSIVLFLKACLKGSTAEEQ
ncbi:hypothetical protein Y032_0039g104 [Ancylostoma ceylanicum]|uniref:Tyrosine-protein kinase n=1 Tax=Ancylostoma ceylanicum TaxID=53326 RepID=A0A016UH58_9BILA|nr:hypothetical protein Y032_0039g104 [Ancylostoma ceylanicum]